ncbi:nuclear transport factor 2 family protein [Sphingobium sp. H39-3-25]|uniref:nuclear transport factor 2 family protein n=1 Tax=Sphingobium arseniciresistens TaxID=3030834 RepID=UPI0023B97969|nr:nuclear transport factor 2 family protein [Sphingobium arseniciresistens]
MIADHALAIANLKARYCAAADLAASDTEAARAMMGELFTDDFVGDYGFDPLNGPSAIIDFLCTMIGGNSQWAVHMLHSPRIEVGETMATGDWTVLVHLKRRGAGNVDVVLGRYRDQFRLTSQGWKIEKVAFTRAE